MRGNTYEPRHIAAPVPAPARHMYMYTNSHRRACSLHRTYALSRKTFLSVSLALTRARARAHTHAHSLTCSQTHMDKIPSLLMPQSLCRAVYSRLITTISMPDHTHTHTHTNVNTHAHTRRLMHDLASYRELLQQTFGAFKTSALLKISLAVVLAYLCTYKYNVYMCTHQTQNNNSMKTCVYVNTSTLVRRQVLL